MRYKRFAKELRNIRYLTAVMFSKCSLLHFLFSVLTGVFTQDT